MIYRFNVKETNYGVIAVEADSYEEAEEKAWEEYSFGNTMWGDIDTALVDVDIETEEENENFN